MPMLLNCPFTGPPIPSLDTASKCGKGCSYFSTRIKKLQKNDKKERKQKQEFTEVKSKFSLTPALRSILTSLGYKVKK